MRPPVFTSDIVRISGRPRPEIAKGVPRPQRSRRAHHDATVRDVQGMIEQTTLTYEEIARRTGVSPASISRWSSDREWKRPLFAPCSMLSVPTPRATLYNRHRLLARRLTALAERYVQELEDAPAIDLDKLAQALELSKIAKLSAMRRTPRRREAALWHEPMRPVIELCDVGVDIQRAPREAVEDFLANREKPREEDKPPGSRGRGQPRYLTRAQRHAKMMERE